MATRMRSRSRSTAAAALLLFTLAAISAAPAHAQTAGDIAVIVHPAAGVDNLSLAELRRILLGDREFWPSGERITLLLRAPVARERDAAVRDVCQMSEAQFRQHWIGKVFRAETPSGPKIVYSSQMALDQAARTPGALTFVAVSAVPKDAKVIKIDGRLPGQAGYRLK
jgi:hypothetical protein